MSEPITLEIDPMIITAFLDAADCQLRDLAISQIESGIDHSVHKNALLEFKRKYQHLDTRKPIPGY